MILAISVASRAMLLVPQLWPAELSAVVARDQAGGRERARVKG